ncbi:MAG TPA: hypothetical protein VHL34_24715 [Rhizomicrobium sp.]|jgi:hypothetical protein|nr:hypothetical protein [Rhizomicrobium sp.]
MTPHLEVVWSGAKERTGEAPGLSSPFIGSVARLCIEAGSNRLKEGVLKVRYQRKGYMTCQAPNCGARFKRVGMERMCSSCFVTRNRPVFR